MTKTIKKLSSQNGVLIKFSWLEHKEIASLSVSLGKADRIQDNF